jgi:hypothetical protein
MKFRAPWGSELYIVTALGAATLILPVYVVVSKGAIFTGTAFAALIVVIMSLCVRGYELGPGELRIRRLWWDTRWPLDAGTRASVRPNAMEGSWRMWGNAGLFGISGHFSGSGLGSYRAFVTDPARTVVLETRKGVVVVSPDRPAEFASAVVDCAILKP